MSFLSGLSIIAPRYDAFIFDLWGVIHDGSKLYPNALDTLAILREEGKRIVFLSNAPRRTDRVIHVLDELGVDRALYDGAVSSGELAYRTFATRPACTYYYLGPERDAGLFEGLPHRRTERLEEADLLINCGPFDDQAPADAADRWLVPALEHGLPMHCVNPDLVVVKQDGSTYTCAGALAQRYGRLGGHVVWYGKPHAEIYTLALETLGQPPLSRVLAVGDGPETDIAGAQGMQVDNVLVSGGILRIQLGDAALTDAAAVDAVCRTHAVSPVYLLPSLIW